MPRTVVPVIVVARFSAVDELVVDVLDPCPRRVPIVSHVDDVLQQPGAELAVYPALAGCRRSSSTHRVWSGCSLAMDGPRWTRTDASDVDSRVVAFAGVELGGSATLDRAR